MSALVVMISHDLIGQRMAGMGMRFLELARVLARRFMVTLAAPEGSSLPCYESNIEVMEYARHSDMAAALGPLVRAANVVVAAGDILGAFPSLPNLSKCLVIDAYAPHTFESLAWNESFPFKDRMHSHYAQMRLLHMQCVAGDFFICASERQRSLWIGRLEIAGRVNPYTYSEDHSLRSLVDVVQSGVPSDPPVHTRPSIRGVVPGISASDRILVWGGGIWNWLDPLTLIRAVAAVALRYPSIRLYFPGPRHPDEMHVPDMHMREAAIGLSKELGMWGKHVFFGDWVPYHERHNYLLEADLGCSLHLDSVEARFALRTRVLDYIWAGLPMVVTQGDSTAELVKKYGLGIVVGYGDVAGVADAILQLLNTPRAKFKERFARARQDLCWERSALPLVRFCSNPRQAPDKGLIEDLMVDQEREIARLRSIIAGYERGKFMRFMRLVHAIKERLVLTLSGRT